jgi:membrane protein YdbS with pleckstrin-like domain
MPPITQRTWRTIGALALAGCALMAWYTARHAHAAAQGGPFWIVFAIVFLALLATTLYMTLIDIRYIRLQYKIAERELFRDTLGNEDFREQVRQAQARKQDADQS